ncbi:ABC-type phosphate transport system, periplasmic component [hydrothermal vent metagenome]|uniref:ABC-type phosphate transport system, periplasmic component n=1 Tax=hydrothermal vent metagenome TaxID=652676 RepID=A0A3B0YDQ2_9ZZZZ
MKNLIKLLSVALALLSFNAQAELAIVVDPSVKLDSISVEQLERLYMNRANRFPGGVALQALDQRSGSAQREAFVSRVLNMSEIEMAVYWSKRMFSGKGRPPRSVEGDSAVIEKVTKEPGVIGYIDGDSVDDSVKVLLRIP